jgi:hypothetical protein
MTWVACTKCLASHGLPGQRVCRLFDLLADRRLLLTGGARLAGFAFAAGRRAAGRFWRRAEP